MFSRRHLTALALLVLSACSSVTITTRPATPEEALKGDEMAKKMVDSLGGLDAYRKLRIISFDFAVGAIGLSKTKEHIDWDPMRNVARVVSGSDEVIMDCGSKKGRAFVDGKEVTEPGKVQKAITDAYAAWVNDTYWLVSPFKLFDEGARRAWMDGKLRISFEERIGLTPGDVYQYTLADDGKPVHWAFNLQNGLKMSADFEKPITHDGVTLYSYKPSKVMAVTLANLDFSATPRPEIFKGM